MQDNNDAPDKIHEFLLHADKVVKEAKFLVGSLPNAEEFAVERALRHIYSVFHILSDLNDPHLSAAEIEKLNELLLDTAYPLYDFLRHPPPPPNTGKTFIHTGRPGRPKTHLNLQRALELHEIGCSWDSIAQAIGVTRQTLYNQMKQADLSTQRPQYTEIGDDDLDEVVAGISLLHPFAGSSILKGHLEAKDIKLPILRVQESLQRVDPIGVFIR